MKTEKIKGNKITACLVLFCAMVVAFISGQSFYSMRNPLPNVDMVKPQMGFKEKNLSDYFKGLADTPSDTRVYIQEGAQKGGTVLLLGGTHANEPAALLSAVLILERAIVKKGKLIVIPFNNPMNRNHTAAQDAHPMTFAIDQPNGGKEFSAMDLVSPILFTLGLIRIFIFTRLRDSNWRDRNEAT